MRLACFALILAAAFPGWSATLPPRRADYDGDIIVKEPRRIAPLVAKLEALDFYGSTEALNLRFSLTNRSNRSLWVLKWQIPGQDLEAPLFKIQRDGETVSYTGRLVKRANPEADDYLEIKAGETYSVVFDPSDAYEMNLQGQYRVDFQVRKFATRLTAPEVRNVQVETSLLALREVDQAPPPP